MQKFFQRNNIRLHYLDFPAATDDRPTLIFLPGLTANATFAAGAITAGLNEHVRVLSLDFRGRGLSDKPELGYTMADYVDDVLGLMEVEQLNSAIICGHSFGGLIGMIMADIHPDKVSHFIILDSSHLLVTERTANLIKSSLDRLGVRIPSLQQYLSGIQHMPWLNGYWDDDLQTYFTGDVEMLEDGSVLPKTPADAIRQTIDHEFEVDWVKHVAGIHQPVLLVRAPGPYGPAGAPPILPDEMAAETAALIKNCTYQTTTGNHITMLFGQHAQNTVEIITTWLESIREHAQENKHD